MGLDTTHDCWHGAYSAFHRWRCAVAKASGIEDLETWWNENTLPEDAVYGEWKKFPDDPLIVLLNHSDCEGKIPVIHCAPLADRLEGLLPALEKMGNGGGHIQSYVEKTKKFIEGLRFAVESGEDVKFH